MSGWSFGKCRFQQRGADEELGLGWVAGKMELWETGMDAKLDVKLEEQVATHN